MLHVYACAVGRRVIAPMPSLFDRLIRPNRFEVPFYIPTTLTTELCQSLINERIFMLQPGIHALVWPTLPLPPEFTTLPLASILPEFANVDFREAAEHDAHLYYRVFSGPVRFTPESALQPDQFSTHRYGGVNFQFCSLFMTANNHFVPFMHCK